MTPKEQKIYDVIRETQGLKGKQIAERLKLDKYEVNSLLANSKELKKLVVKKENYCWYLIDSKGLNNAPSGTAGKSVALPGTPLSQTRSKRRDKKEDENPYPKGKERGIQYVEGICCQLCGKPMVLKAGRYGRFYACSEYPVCRFSYDVQEPIPGKCPVCGNSLVEGHTKKGYVYYRCEEGKDCGFITWHIPTDEKCEKCGKTLFWPKRTNLRICLNKACTEFQDEKPWKQEGKPEEKGQLKKAAARPEQKSVEKPTAKPFTESAGNTTEKPKDTEKKITPGKLWNNI